MRNFRPTNPHGTAFPPMKCLYQMEAMGMEKKKMYCSSPWNNPTYLCGSANYPILWWQYRAESGSMRKFGPTYRHGTVFAQEECLYQKEATGMESRKMYCSSLWKNPTYLYGSATYSVSWVQYRAENGNMRNFGPTNPYGTALAPKQWLYQEKATGMES